MRTSRFSQLDFEGKKKFILSIEQNKVTANLWESIREFTLAEIINEAGSKSSERKSKENRKQVKNN